MRIADKMNYDQVTSQLSKNRSDIAELQNQAATQKRLTKPSDDPLASARVLGARTELRGQTQYLKNISQARAFLEYTDQSLGELTDVLIRAKELALGQVSDASSNAHSREVVAAEVAQLFQQAVQIGNRKLGDRFLFGGFRTTSAPFTYSGEYFGDDGQISIGINKAASVVMNIPGNHAFLGQSDSSQNDNNYQGSTSAIEDQASEEKSKSSAMSSPSVFRVLQNLKIGLTTDSKESVQDALDDIDRVLEHVVLTRSQVGSRVSTLQASAESLMKGQVDTKTMASQLEDVDTFEVVSDLNKAESTLKAALSTSAKLMQPSLLDFLR